MSESSSKINWITVATVVGSLAAVGALIFTALNYFQPSPYKLEATGEYVNMYLPSSLLTIRAADLESLLQKDPPIDEEKKRIILNVSRQIINLTYRQNYIFTLRNKGNKEVSNVKLIFPGSGIYEVLRKDPIGKTENFSNEIPVGNISPTDEFVVLVWTDNESVRDARARMRFVHPEGVVPVKFASDSPQVEWANWLNIPSFIAILILLIYLFRFREKLSAWQVERAQTIKVLEGINKAIRVNLPPPEQKSPPVMEGQPSKMTPIQQENPTLPDSE